MTKNTDTRKAREKAGRRSELLAELYLRVRGYRILERRYKSHQGEIDLIASRKDVLAIVEVKQRDTLAKAQDSLMDYGQTRITKAAESYYAQTPRVQKLGIRFDAVFVVGRWKIFHEVDAWRDY